MSSLPPLPPHLQAMLERKYPEYMGILDKFIEALRHDPKRDPDNPADYMNTVSAMLMEHEHRMEDGAVFTRLLAALAFIELADSGWRAGAPSPDLPGIEPPDPAMRRWPAWIGGAYIAALALAALAVIVVFGSALL